MSDRSDAAALIARALEQGQPSLSEHDSKRVLSAYGVRTVEEAFADTPDAAADAAARLGFPAAVKGCGAGLAHKSDRGLVRLHLADAAAVRAAAEALLAAGAPGLLVQRMARGRRELIIGGARDAAFGPQVMLGLGGVSVEAVGDVAFRLPPVDARDVREMVLELRGRRLFDAFRGGPPVCPEALETTLNAAGRILLDHPGVSHVDINPLVVEDGIPVAVDALVSLSPDAAAPPEGTAPVWAPERFLALFEPETVAVVGASDSPLKWGFRILFNTLEGGYRGRLYGVNPRHKELLGVPCFPSVAELPEAPDLAVIVIPPPGVPDAVRACAARGVKAVVVITAGFGELEDAAARGLQDEVVRAARETGLLLAGPNCAGVAGPAPQSLYCGMFVRHPGPGGLSIVSQSGNVGGTALAWAQFHQAGVARFISTGNEAVLRTADYLRFLAGDPATAAVLAYVEGVRPGDGFFGALRAAAAAKPVVVLKGGRSAAGLQAARSHTGALSGGARVFRAACRQAGAVAVDDPLEAMELAAAFAAQPLPKGRRVGIVSQGGGWGVLAADACVEEGLEVAVLPEETLAELDAFLPGWWSRGNPVDLVAGNDLMLQPKAVETVIKSPAVDAVIVLGVGYIADSVARFAASDLAKGISLDQLAAMGAGIEVEGARQIAALAAQYGKPVLAASDTALGAPAGHPNAAIAELERLGVCVLSSPSHAARVLARLAERREFLDGTPRR
ncbi:MAG: CoA-binding protein [Candidatus Hydrogenedentes bacterium]|nr:CoA-binding protein [Candidatus Hydrogenedentota bacterium]